MAMISRDGRWRIETKHERGASVIEVREYGALVLRTESPKALAAYLEERGVDLAELEER